MAAPRLFVKRFWTKFRPDPGDAAKLVGSDWCEYGPIGSVDRSTTCDSIKNLRDRLQPMTENNPAIELAYARWAAIEPAYERWKNGQEMPLSGTPLAAWNAVTPEQSEVFKTRGIRTVEEIAQLTDVHVEKLGPLIPRMRDLIRQAQMFVESADTVRFAASLDEKQQKIAAQDVEIAEQRTQIADLLAKVNQLADMVAAQAPAEPVKRGPGRPPKQEAA
jgi:sulfur carrier protein ThiS